MLCISVIRPLRGPIRSVTTPTADCGTSQTISSIGSWTWPPTSLVIGSGFETVSS